MKNFKALGKNGGKFGLIGLLAGALYVLTGIFFEGWKVSKDDDETEKADNTKTDTDEPNTDDETEKVPADKITVEESAN